MDLNQVWQAALGEIELQVSRPNFLTWFKNSRLLEKEEGVALVSLPNNFAKEWIENKYHKIILAALRNLDETTKKIEYTIDSKADAVPKIRKNKTVSNINKDFKEQPLFNE